MTLRAALEVALAALENYIDAELVGERYIGNAASKAYVACTRAQSTYTTVAEKTEALEAALAVLADAAMPGNRAEKATEQIRIALLQDGEADAR